VIQQNTETYSRHFNEDFKENYKGRQFDYNGTGINRPGYKNGQNADYDPNHEEPEYKDSQQTTLTLSPILSFTLIALLIVAFVYLVYIIITEGGTGIFKSSSKKIAATDISDITISDLQKLDMQHLIIAAEKEEDYRLAIRYYNLWTLKSLNNKNHIKLEEDKTNEDYQRELKVEALRKPFSYISYIYSYVWYGEFSLSSVQYEKAKTNFVEFLKRLN